MKQIFSSLFCVCFLVVFSFSVGAAEALSEAIASLDTAEKYGIINMIMSREPNALSHGKVFRITTNPFPAHFPY